MVDEQKKEQVVESSIAKDPSSDNPQKSTPPSQSQDGQGQREAGSTLPEKFKGKSPEEIAHSYLELEKKIGEHSGEVKQVRDQLSQWEALGRVIKGNPDLELAINKEIEKLSGVKTEDKPKEQKVVRDDTRKALEDQIINGFSKEYGIENLPGEKRQALYEKIGKELKEMVDLVGNRSYAEIINDIPLDRLPTYLKKAYKLATSDDREERARAEAYIQAKQNAEASFGSISSSGVSSETVELTPAQKESARRMGISEEDIKKQLIEMQKGA